MWVARNYATVVTLHRKAGVFDVTNMFADLVVQLSVIKFRFVLVYFSFRFSSSAQWADTGARLPTAEGWSGTRCLNMSKMPCMDSSRKVYL